MTLAVRTSGEAAVALSGNCWMGLELFSVSAPCRFSLSAAIRVELGRLTSDMM